MRPPRRWPSKAALPNFEQAVQEAPNDGIRRAGLGLLYAFMGRKEAAIEEGRRAVELTPLSQDAVDGALDEKLSRVDIHARWRVTRRRWS